MPKKKKYINGKSSRMAYYWRKKGLSEDEIRRLHPEYFINNDDKNQCVREAFKVLVDFFDKLVNDESFNLRYELKILEASGKLDLLDKAIKIIREKEGGV